MCVGVLCCMMLCGDVCCRVLLCVDVCCVMVCVSMVYVLTYVDVC